MMADGIVGKEELFEVKAGIVGLETEAHTALNKTLRGVEALVAVVLVTETAVETIVAAGNPSKRTINNDVKSPVEPSIDRYVISTLSRIMQVFAQMQVFFNPFLTMLRQGA